MKKNIRVRGSEDSRYTKIIKYLSSYSFQDRQTPKKKHFRSIGSTSDTSLIVQSNLKFVIGVRSWTSQTVIDVDSLSMFLLKGRR